MHVPNFGLLVDGLCVNKFVYPCGHAAYFERPGRDVKSVTGVAAVVEASTERVCLRTPELICTGEQSESFKISTEGPYGEERKGESFVSRSSSKFGILPLPNISVRSGQMMYSAKVISTLAPNFGVG